MAESDSTLFDLGDVKKRCTECHESKPLTDFDRRTVTGTGRIVRKAKCKKCCGAKTQAWQKRNPEKIKASWRRQQLKNKYGLDETDYWRMFESQNGKCAVCAGPPDVKRAGRPALLSVDHDHKTGLVRQLLCSRCNLVLGMCGEDIAVFEGLIAYLKRHQNP